MKFKMSFVRSCKGFTIEEIAKTCGVTVSEMKAFEDGSREITASVLIKLRRLYKIPVDYISF